MLCTLSFVFFFCYYVMLCFLCYYGNINLMVSLLFTNAWHSFALSLTDAFSRLFPDFCLKIAMTEEYSFKYTVVDVFPLGYRVTCWRSVSNCLLEWLEISALTSLGSMAQLILNNIETKCFPQPPSFSSGSSFSHLCQKLAWVLAFMIRRIIT